MWEFANAEYTQNQQVDTKSMWEFLFGLLLDCQSKQKIMQIFACRA